MITTTRRSKLVANKPLLIVLEGPDKVGKTTVYQALRRATNYKPLVIDRFTGSNLVYDQFYNRDTDILDYYKIEEELMILFNVVVVHLTCQPTELVKRIEIGETGVDKTRALDSYQAIADLYLKYIRDTPYNFVFTIDTTFATPSEVVSQIMKGLGELGYEQ